METARLFNSALASVAISSAFELGLLQELESNGIIHVPSYCSKTDLHEPTVGSIFRTLACFDIVEITSDPDVLRQGPAFAETYRDKGYFLWLIRGYGHLLQNLADFARCANRPTDNDDLSFVRRSVRHVAMAGRDYGSHFVDRCFEDVLSELPFTVVCDLGCGSAERLVTIAKKYPGSRGIGVDINVDIVRLAQVRIKEESLEDRVTVLAGNVIKLRPRPEFADVDLLICFFMGHDLWPRERCEGVMQGFFDVFPKVQRFLFCDTHRSDVVPSPYIPIFTLGFELTHAVMGQYIPSEVEWLTLFEETGWRCVGKREVGIPFSAIFDLRPGRA